MTELIEQLDFSSSGSLAKMAEKMLDNDFKASHPDLVVWMEEQHLERRLQSQNNLSDGNQNDGNGKTYPSRTTSAGGLKDSVSSGGLRTSPSKRSNADLRVVIQEPPNKNSKRRKLDPSLTTRRLVYEIGTSATASERLDILARAKDFLDHTYAAGHDEEIAESVDVALVKQLTLLIMKLSRCQRNNHASQNSGVNCNDPSYPQLLAPEEETLPTLIDEVCSALEALEMVYRASDTAVGESFQKIGHDLLHVLVTLIDEELHRRVVSGDTGSNMTNVTRVGLHSSLDKDNAHAFKPIQKETTDNKEMGVDSSAAIKTGDVSQSTDSTPELQRPVTPLYVKTGSPEGNFLILKATKIIGNLARVGQSTKDLAYFPGLLSCLLHLVNYQPYDAIPWEARLSALWALGQLACNPENMLMMTCTPGLVRSLVRVGCRALHAGDPMEVTMEVLRSRSLSSRALLNLSWKPENKIPLSENFALLELLTQLAVHRKAPALNNSRTVKSILLQTRCHAVGALRNLAAAPRRTKIHLCEYKNGHVLDALTDVALNEPDVGIRNRAFAAIHNLAVHDTAQKMVERPALVLALKDVLLEEDGTAPSGNNDNNKGKEGSPKSHASATLLVLERTITPEMDSYGNLRDLLDAVNPTVASDNDDDSNQKVKAIEV